MHPLQEMINRRREEIPCGIPSYCSANELVIETILERSKETNNLALIEATANQVNQFGGYTGMKPQDFVNMVLAIAKKVECDKELIILAGDHLGPLTWQKESAQQAMEKAGELVRQYVLAGFTKIHLDTSMKLGDDSMDQPLATEVIAERGVELYAICMKAYEELKMKHNLAPHPVFIIGSEVPIPGGAQEEEGGIEVTKPEDFEDTINTYKRIFKKHGYKNAWKDIIAVVVQPGVEFGDSQVFLYDPKEAKALCDKLKDYPQLVFEGHSTDYQSKECLKKMVRDGIAILKVGPALTFGLREALFAMSMMEQELIEEEKQAKFIDVLDEVMKESPENWNKHYHGDKNTLGLSRKYSFSDRCRYYIGEEKVVAAMETLFDNLRKSKIPMHILHQYMPVQYSKVRDGKLELEPRVLAKDGVVTFIEDYEYAVAYEKKE